MFAFGGLWLCFIRRRISVFLLASRRYETFLVKDRVAWKLGIGVTDVLELLLQRGVFCLVAEYCFLLRDAVFDASSCCVVLHGD